MKRVLCLLLTGMMFLGMFFFSSVIAPSSCADQLVSEVEEISLPQPDFAEMFAAHAPDEVVATVNGHKITWEVYFYFYYSTASSLLDMMNYYANFGAQLSWNDVYDTSSGITYAQLPVINAGQDIMRFWSIADFAADAGVTLNETSKAVLSEKIRADQEAFSAEADPEAAFAAWLSSARLPEELYRFLAETSILYQQAFADLYGEDGSSVPDDEVIAFLEENGYISGAHLYLAFADAYTGETESEDAVRAKRERAEALVTELNGIEDVQERRAAFDAYRAELDEDAISFYFPDGYTICGGYIPDELFSALKAAEADSVIRVETTSGIYVAMKFSPDPDGLTGYSEQGTPLTARAFYASEDYAARLEKQFAETDFQYAKDFEVPDINDYFH